LYWLANHEIIDTWQQTTKKEDDMTKMTEADWSKASLELEAKYLKSIAKAIAWMDTLEWNDKAFSIITVGRTCHIGTAAAENALQDCKTIEECYTTETLDVYEASLGAICEDIQRAYEQR
jgi:hypothetical protein